MKEILTPERFDALVQPVIKHDRIIWTAKAIGRRIGRGEDFVRRVLVNLPGSPVQKQGHRLYAVEVELLDFFRTPHKPA